MSLASAGGTDTVVALLLWLRTLTAGDPPATPSAIGP